MKTFLVSSHLPSIHFLLLPNSLLYSMASAIASGSTYIFPSSSSSSHFSHSTLIPPQHTHLESGNEEEDSEEEDSQDDETKLQQGLSEDEEVELKYSNSTKRKGKNWVCEYKGCGKSYTRRTRLEEHERTHTGEVSLCFPWSPIHHFSVTFVRLNHLILTLNLCTASFSMLGMLL